MLSEPRDFSPALYAFQFFVGYCFAAGFAIAWAIQSQTPKQVTWVPALCNKASRISGLVGGAGYRDRTTMPDNSLQSYAGKNIRRKVLLGYYRPPST